VRYKVSEIEDQILATLKADTTNLSGLKTLETYAGQVSPEMFFDPEYMQGFVALLPFMLVAYQGEPARRSIGIQAERQEYIYSNSRSTRDHSHGERSRKPSGELMT
jgi:hypothetical protein